MQILYKILKFFEAVFRFTLHWPLVLFYYRKGKVVPILKNPLLLKSATQLAKEIRERKLKSADVVQAYIVRIQEVESFINATVDLCFKDALEEANKADWIISSGMFTEEQLIEEKPLLGVPFTVKEIIFVKGLRCTGGSKLFKDLLSTEDAPSVALMKEAGAIVIATTNSPEFSMSMETSNLIHGRTSNPYNTNRTPGGSSGGESALIASGGSVVGLGNDALGSIRIPAHFTGIFAHKPTGGLVPSEGAFPPTSFFCERFPKPDALDYTCTGPMCRYAEDLTTIMKVLSTNSEVKMRLGKKVNFQKLKICYLKEMQSYFVSPVDPEISRALQAAVSYFQQHYGIEAREVKMPCLMDAPRCIHNAIHNSLSDFTKMLTERKAIDFNLKIDLLKSFFGKSKLSFATLCALNFSDFPLIYKKSKNCQYENDLKHWINEFNNLLDEDTVLLMPTLPFTAPYHGEGILLFVNVCYTGIFNILGLPSTSCPIGLNKYGMPIGIQIVSCKNNDHLTIACANVLEEAFGGWKAPGND